VARLRVGSRSAKWVTLASVGVREEGTEQVERAVNVTATESKLSGLRGRLRSALRPPDQLDRTTWSLLGTLTLIAATAGFQGSLPTVLMTYVAEYYGASKSQQTGALAIIRLDILLTVVFVRLADRVGRSRVIVICAGIGPILTSCCALMNSLPQFVTMQVLSRSFVTATAILASIFVVEHLPATSRGWGAGWLVGSAALGSAIAQGATVIAGRSANGWRWPFLLPVLTLPILFRLKRRVIETPRFQTASARSEAHDVSLSSAFRTHGRRLLTLAVVAGFVGLQNNASRQVRSDYLRTQRGFNGDELALFGVLTNAPGLFGVLVGSLVSDRKHRKVIVCLGLLAVAVGDFGVFSAHGTAIWLWAMFGALIGAAALPGLSILTSELFPTTIRSTASGLTTMAARVFGLLGLVLVSFTVDRYAGGNQGPIIRVLSISLVLAVIVLWFATPETARKELEELNPQDA
jgi:MFS transporter, putative metabolite:H+ symporter